MEKRYYPQLDTLRFLAMCAIIRYHYITHQLPGGFLAVDFFFILSGYLVTAKLERQYAQGEPLNLVRTFLKRIWWLFVPMFVVIILTLSVLFLWRFDLLTNIVPQVFSSLAFVNNWYQIKIGASYFDEFLHPSVLTHLWYLSVYAQFILLWPLVYRAVRPHIKRPEWRAFLTLALVLCSYNAMVFLYQPGSDPTRVYYGTDTRFMSFGLGACLAFIRQTSSYQKLQTFLKPWQKTLITATIGFIMYYLMSGLSAESKWTYQIGLFLFDGLATAFIAGLLEPHLFSYAFRFKPFAWLGKRSYLVYLLYYPIFIIFYMSAQQQNFFTRHIYLQVLVLFLLAALLYEIVVIDRFNVPIYKKETLTRLNWRTQWHQMMNTPFPNASRELFWLFTAGIVTSLLALAIAPSAQSQSKVEQKSQEQVEQNKKANEKLLKKQEEAKKQKNKEAKPPETEQQDTAVAQYISGLSERGQALFEWLTPAERRFAYHAEVTFIGDSLTLGMSNDLYTVFPQAYVDAAVARQLNAAQYVVEVLAQNNQLARYVVINIGTNGGFSDAQIRQMIETIGPDHEIYFSNTHVNRSWRDEVNGTLARVIDEADDHVHLIDWWSEYHAKADPATWLTEDGVHFEFPAAKAWITLLVKRMAATQPPMDATLEKEAQPQVKSE